MEIEVFLHQHFLFNNLININENERKSFEIET